MPSKKMAMPTKRSVEQPDPSHRCVSRHGRPTLKTRDSGFDPVSTNAWSASSARNRVLIRLARCAATARICGPLLFVALSSTLAQANTFTVINNADSGSGSLRQAILDANAIQNSGGTHCAPHSIVFNIPGGGTHTIRPLSALPHFNIPITLDGYTQPGSSLNTQTQGSNAVLAIELDGSLAGASDAIVIGASLPTSPLCPGSLSVISGLVINRFAGAAISMGEEFCATNSFCPVGGVRIQGNFFGTDVSGSIALGNGLGMLRPTLVFGRGSTNNLVGDELASLGGPINPLSQTLNVISAGGADGIYIGSPRADARSQDHHIRNNIIGLNAQGTAALANAGRGITVDMNSTGIAIHDNLISGNVGDGVAIFDSPFMGTALVANGIGIGVGAVPLGNGGDGVLISGNVIGAFVGAPFRLLPFGSASISNNLGAGLFIDGPAQVDASNSSIGGNGGLAIDLAPAGVTPNDPGDGDSGPNELLNKPLIQSAIYDPGTLTTTIAGSLDAAPGSSYEVHFYISNSCDASGFGGGSRFFPLNPGPVVASVTTDASGNAAFSRQTSGLGASFFLTALTRQFSIATGLPGIIVSEFSACRQVVSSADLIFVDGFDP